MDSGLTRTVAISAVRAVIALAAVVLVGWTFQVEMLKRIAPGFVAMNPMTACGFILAGIGLSLSMSSLRLRRWAMICAIGVAAIGALKLIGIISGWDVGVDQILFRHSLDEVSSGLPNRMAPNTALNFLLAGSALLLLNSGRNRSRLSVDAMALTVAAISLLAIIGYAYEVSALYGVRSFIAMALHTAIAFLMLAAGILCARPDNRIVALFLSDTAGGAMARRLVLPAIFLPVTLGWLRLRGEKIGLFPHEVGTAMFATSLVIVFTALVWRTARSLHRSDLGHRSAEAKARALAAIVESSNDAILSQALDGTILSWNSGAERLYGHCAAEIIGRPFRLLLPPDRVAESQEMVMRIRQGERIEHFRTTRLRKSGETIDVSLTMSPVCDEHGAVTGIASIVRDVTEQKRFEEALLLAREEADRANDAKSEFLSRMSHELRTPMNAILGFGQLLEMDAVGEEQRDFARQILRGGRHLLDLINEVLDIARIESGKLTLSIEPVDAAEVLEDALALIRPLADQRSIRFDTQIPPGCSTAVHADRQRLRQVLLNLFANAIKYNRIGGSVTVSCSPALENKLRIEIRDTGVGITPAQMEKLFVPFERLGAEQTDVEGSGIGLALSKRLVELMGGTIGVDTVVGAGSTFWIELSSSAAEVSSGALEAEPAPASGNEDVRVRTVLYIEDNIPNLKLMERVLVRRRGFKLMTAMQGRLGYNLACQHQPDIVLLDLHLPDISGEEVLRLLRTNPVTSEIPVVMISADATRRQHDRLLTAGARAYLTKPLDVPRLFEILDSVAV
jgi:PAS domain S-box-containing protein